jgi:hypothetical protein
MIGFRFEVGADWTAYVAMYKRARLALAIGNGDPGYLALNYTVREAGLPFWWVNVFCGLIFTWGLHRLSSLQEEPWLALLIAVPYLVIVVAMGYARQGVAIGILMGGLASLMRTQSIPRYVVAVAIAALFHRTAIIAILFVGLGGARSRVPMVVLLIFAAGILYTSLLQSHVDALIQGYIGVRWSAQGALIRILMVVLPATIFLLNRGKLGFNDFERRIWRNFSVAAFGSLLMLAVVPSSTAVDRLALYIMPLQLAVLPRVPKLIGSQVFGRLAIIFYAAAVQFVWLNYGQNAISWYPYKSYIPSFFTGLNPIVTLRVR